MRRDQDGTYVLTSVIHSAHTGGDYASTENDEAYYSNNFTCIPFSVPYRPARMTPKPLMQGSQTAFVVGPSGEEIYVDEYGRVKVQFHWDREGKYDEKSSCWIRTSQPWAGNKWGGAYWPRIGQEVIVDFLEGDPDMPIITGRVYNAESMPPYKLPDEKTKTVVFKSDSSLGGGGFNELRVEDKKGKEQIFIHAERNKDIRIKKDLFETVGGSAHHTVDGDQFELVGGDKHDHVKGDHIEKVDGSASLTVGMDLQEKIGMKYAHEAGMEIHLKAGMNIVIEAGVQLTLKAAGSFIDINPAGIAISGPMVLINSGGAAGTGSGSSPDTPKDPTEADKAEAGEKAKLQKPKVKKARKFSSSATALKRAAENGMPFTEI
jgi:type VI secretion system secreted protein VgrG